MNSFNNKPHTLTIAPSTMIKPIGVGDIALNVRGRPDKLPTIYKAKNHPHRRIGNVFYYIQDVSPEGMKQSFEIEESMQIPHGPPELARALGEYDLDVRGNPSLIYPDRRFFRDKGR